MESHARSYPERTWYIREYFNIIREIKRITEKKNEKEREITKIRKKRMSKNRKRKLFSFFFV